LSVIEEGCNDGFAVVDLAGIDKLQEFGERIEFYVDTLIFFGLCLSRNDVAGDPDIHRLSKKAGRSIVTDKVAPFFRAVAGLFDEFAFGSGERALSRIEAACGNLEEELSSRVAVLTFDDDEGVVGIRGLVYAKDGDRAVVVDDVPFTDDAAGFFYLVGVNGEEMAFVGDFGRDDASFTERGLLLFRGGFFGWGRGFFAGRFDRHPVTLEYFSYWRDRKSKILAPREYGNPSGRSPNDAG